MSTIDKLGIIGVRSYTSDRLEHIEFFKPLTIIWGPNGSGKTTIIECLKLVTSGSYPPNSQNGKTFILDPKLIGKPEVKAQIKLKFRAVNKRQVIGIRSFQLTAVKDKRTELKTIEQVLKTRDDNGEIVSINHTCTEMERQVPELLGVSKAVLENVIFCHQEDSLWPFGDTATLKNIFDELFDTTMYTKLFETIKTIHKNISKSNKELQTKLIFYKRDFENHISRKSKVLKDAEILNDDVKKFEDQEKVIRFWEDKKKDLDSVEKELKSLEMDLNLVKYKRENFIKEASILKGTLTKTFDQDSIEGLVKCKELLIRKYRDFENEIKDKSFRLETQKSLAEVKKKELEELLKTEKNDSNLLNEMSKTRDELASQLRIRQENYETDEIYNERIAKNAEANVLAVEKESQEILSQFEKEERKLEVEIEEKQKEISTIKMELQRNESEYHQKKEKIRENEGLLAEFEQKKQEKAFFLSKIEEIDQTLQAYGLDLELTVEKFEESQKKQEQLASQIKKINEIRKQLSIKKEYALTLNQISDLQSEIQIINTECENILNPLGLSMDSDLKQLKSKLNTFNNGLNELNKTFYDIQENSHEITANISIAKKEMTESDKKLKNFEKIFNKSGISSVLKGEAIDFSNKWKELKNEILENEKKLIIMEYTHTDLQNYLLENSKLKKKCEFCEQALNNFEIEKLEKNILNQRKERGEKHCVEIREKIILLKKEKEVLKSKKKDYEAFCDLKRKIIELTNNLQQKEIEKEDIQLKIEEISKRINEENEKIKNLKAAIESLEKLKKLENQVFEKEKHSAEISKPFKNKKDLNIDPEEIKLIENNTVFDEFEFAMSDTKQKEKRKQMLINQIEEFKQQKVKLEEFLRKNEEDNDKKTLLINENEKNQAAMLLIRENTSKYIAKIKQTEVEKKSAEEQMKMIKRQAKVSEKDIQKKRTLIEFLLPQFKQKLELIKAITKKKSNRKEQEELEIMKGRLQKDLKGMLEIISEYENFITDKQKVLAERDSHFLLIDNNIKLKEIEKEIIEFDEEIKKKIEFLNEKKLEIDQLNQIKEKIEDEKLKYNSLKEKSKFFLETIEKENSELKLKASQTEETYIESLINYEIKQGIIHDLDIYVKTLESTLLRYHRTKMEEINKIIADTWRDVYDGDDIIKIEIKSDEELSNAKKSKNYNYRIVYFTKNNKELDMKGRCSMGQKVLASIVVRLALAEAFGINCGILALDEPTTNLDKGNIRKLAKELGNLIKTRKGNENFQLIIITHDREFVKMLNEYTENYYEICKDDKGNSTINLKNIDFI